MVEGLDRATSGCLVASLFLVSMELEEVLLGVFALEVEGVYRSVDGLSILRGALREEYELEVRVELDEHLQHVGSEAEVGRLFRLALLGLPAEHEFDGRRLQVLLLGEGLRRG